MTKSEVIQYYGSQAAAARALRNISAAGVRQWPERVPPRRQFEIERETNGRLRIDPDLLTGPTDAVSS